MRLVALWRVPLDRRLQMPARFLEFARPERRHPEDVFGLDDEHRVLVALRGGEQRDSVLPRVGKLEPNDGADG